MSLELAERLRRVLERHCHDGSETHHVVDHELRGLDHGTAAANIKRAVKAKYQNTISIDAVIEIVVNLADDGELT
jgi:hypothetical protein